MAILVLVLGALALTGCGGLGQGKGLLLANIGWDENVAVSNLTKVLLEDELNYQRVDINTSEDLDATYRDVASGELDAFQDVWLPNQEALLDQVAEEVEHLDPWFLGETKTLSENRQIEQNVGAGQLNQCQPVFSLLRPASAQAATLDQPRDRPLHYPSPRWVNSL